MRRGNKGFPQCIALRMPRPATEPRDGPTRNFHENAEKYPRLKILDPQRIPPKYPENPPPPKNPKHQKCPFWIFLYFGGIFRFRPGVFGKGVGNSQNASEMRQKCVKNASEMRQNGSCFIRKRGTSKMRQKCVNIASKMRQKCAEHLRGRTPFGRCRIFWGSRISARRAFFWFFVLEIPGPAISGLSSRRGHS